MVFGEIGVSSYRASAAIFTEPLKKVNFLAA
jgi:hypothetical protein